MIAAAAMAFASCSDKTEWLIPEAEEAISIAPDQATFQAEGGVSRTIVTSSDKWNLTSSEEYDWVEVSRTSGKDGDVVAFTVAENFEQDKQAEYVFTCGKATANYKIYSYAGEAPAVKLLSDASYEFDCNAQKIAVKVQSDLNYRELSYKIVKDDDVNWLIYKACIPGDTDNEATFHFDVEALSGLADRDAVIEISGEGLLSAKIELVQLAKKVLYTEQEFYKSEIEGGEIKVPVVSNVEYSINIPEEAKSWLKYKGHEDGNEVFTVEALKSGHRATEVEFVQTDAKEGVEALSAKITITQVETIIRWAADMTGSRLFPKWISGENIYNPVPEYDNWENYTKHFTLETMFRAENFDRPAGGIFTLMGIEGYFLLRFGDIGNPVDRLQIAFRGKNYNLPFQFEAKKWYHIAVTYDDRHIIVYVDGEPIFDQYPVNVLNIFPAWSYENGGWGSSRSFWYGYSYDPNRDFRGMMTEMRIWTKALSKEEINAPNHFYKVAEDAEGLACYWKFTEGEGAQIENKSTSKDAFTGQPLFGETNVRKQSGGNRGDAGIDWVEVALPEN